MQHVSRLKAMEHAQRIDQAATCGLHLVVCAINGSPPCISILPPLILLGTNNNLVHDNFSQKKGHLRHALGVHGIRVHRYSYFQDMCHYHLSINTPPTPLRKLSKGPTVLAHPLAKFPESGARKAEKCQKKTLKDLQSKSIMTHRKVRLRAMNT